MVVMEVRVMMVLVTGACAKPATMVRACLRKRRRRRKKKNDGAGSIEISLPALSFAEIGIQNSCGVAIVIRTDTFISTTHHHQRPTTINPAVDLTQILHLTSPPTMRRGPGIAALDRTIHSASAYSTLSASLTASQLTELRSQLDLFSTALRQFSSQHRNEIRKNPEFRHAFQKMCYSIGVDPLSSSTRGSSGGLAGLWSDMLGLGDWAFELGVQIIDVCVSTRGENGGVMSMDDLIRRVTRLRTGDDKASTGKAAEITEDDIVRSIKMLAPLGCGYEVFSLGDGGQKMVRSVPRELDTDTMIVLAMLLSTTTSSTHRELPFLTEDSLVSGQKTKGWTRDRARAVLENMTSREGMLWIDEQAFPPRYYSLATLTAG